MNDFPERLSALLEEREDSNAELAKALGVSRQTVSAWKTGVRSPRKPMITHIARFFNVEESWLMGLDVERRPFYKTTLFSADYPRDGFVLSSEEKLLVLAYRSATPSAQEIAMEVLSNHPARPGP